MPKAKTSRKQLFRAALAVAGFTAKEWAEREGLGAEHLSRVLNGRRESGALIERIDAFIAKHMEGHTALAS